MPPIATFHLLKNHNNGMIEHFENYQKKSTRNRMKILSPNGILTLSVPLQKGKNNHTLIKDVMISYDENWINKHLNAIRTCYNSAPYYIHYIDDITSIFNARHTHLIDLNNALFQFFIKVIDLEVIIAPTNSYEKEYPKSVTDLRNSSQNREMNFELKYRSYHQVFENKYPFQANLSILDLLMCTGPESILYL